jgi:kinetochore protein Spc25
MKRKDIEILDSKAQTHQQTFEKEAAETNEMRQAIDALTAQRDAQLETRESLKEQIAETQKAIDARLAAQRAYAQQLASQERYNVPELDFWESTLGIRMEGAGVSDKLKFVFIYVDANDWSNEAWFEVDTTARDYVVSYSKPKVEAERVERILDRVNETRDIRILLKGMRELFVEALNG